MEMEPGNAAASVPPQPSADGSNSSLAIVVDKRPAHSPGGCIGIFFQLFNWNRRLSKKNFFSRRFLPQDRATKRISKKLAGEERMPATTVPAVIAAENRGSFFSIKKVEIESAIKSSVHRSDHEKRMISPGLVARLMGLESMPAAARLDRPRHAVDDVSASPDRCIRSDNPGTTSGSPFPEPSMGVERDSIEHGKLQPRPPKQQKLGFFERRPTSASRVGSEALLFSRNMLARSRKQQYKLASPVKSPRLAGRRSSARLMEAATRILEPGLQSRTRSRRALPYMAPARANAQGMDTSVGTSFVSPCHHCGSLVEVPELRLNPNESPAMEYRTSSNCSDFSSTSSHSGFDDTVTSPPAAPKESSRAPSLAVQARANVLSRSNHSVDRKPQLRTGFQEHGKSQLDPATSASNFRRNHLRQTEISFVREGAVSASRSVAGVRGKSELGSFNEVKNFVASNRYPSSCPRAKTAKTMVNRRVAVEERSSWDGKSPLGCKGKSIGTDSRIQTSAAIDSPFPKKRTHSMESHSGDGPRLMTARSVRSNSVKRETPMGEGVKYNSGSRAAAMHAPTRCAGVSGDSSARYGSVTEKTSNSVVRSNEGFSELRNLSTSSTTGKLSSEGALDDRLSALSALLEQKIRELACFDMDKSASVDGVRPTDAVLDHMRSALSAARSISQKDDDSTMGLRRQDESGYEGQGPSVSASSHRPRLYTIQRYQGEAKSGITARLLRSSDYEQHSPMSILEASFSNDSYLSESFNSSSEQRQHAVLIGSSLGRAFLHDLDADLLDSATSSNFRMVEPTKACLSFPDSVPHGYGMGLSCVSPSGSKINYFRGVISNAELLFRHTSLNEHMDWVHYTIDPILIDTLETLANALGGGYFCNLAYPEDCNGLQFRNFLFDYIIEFLDTKYCHYAKMGYKAWVRRPLLTSEVLTQGIYEEIISCRDQTGEIIDEIVQKEMIRTDGEWMYFVVEAFEEGADIGNGLLQQLVDEIVFDLICC